MPLCAYADESVVEDEYTRYYIEALASSSLLDETSSYRYCKGFYAKGNFTMQNKQLVFYFDVICGDINLCAYVYNENGVIAQKANYLCLSYMKQYMYSTDNVYDWNGYYYYYGDEKYKIESLNYESQDLGIDYMWKGSNIENTGFLKTNVPVFSSQDEALQFINGKIGIEDAWNFNSDLLQTITDSDEVPLPKNLRIEYDSTNYNYYLMWEYEPKDLEKLTVIAVTGIDKDLFTSPKNLDNYMRYPADIEFDVSLDEYLEPRLSYKLDITDDVVRLRRTIDEENDFSLADYRVTLDYWVIGSWQKNSTEFHTSKISHVELILDSSDKGFKIDTDNYITDKDMNVLDDVEFDTSIDFDTNNSSSGFIGNLVGAFGLLGSNGFLACCKAVFGCFPSFIWDLLGAGLSAAIIIVLIKMLFS